MAHSKLYVRLMNSAEWRRLRARKLQEQPLCEECLRHGVVRSADCIHHIREVESGRTEQECTRLAFAMTNLMSLCYRCHRAIHTGSRTKDAHAKREEDRRSQFEAHCLGAESEGDALWQAMCEDPGV